MTIKPNWTTTATNGTSSRGIPGDKTSLRGQRSNGRDSRLVHYFGCFGLTKHDHVIAVLVRFAGALEKGQLRMLIPVSIRTR